VIPAVRCVSSRGGVCEINDLVDTFLLGVFIIILFSYIEERLEGITRFTVGVAPLRGGSSTLLTAAGYGRVLVKYKRVSTANGCV